MSGLRWLGRTWHGFWFRSGPADALSLFRICFGIYWLIPWLMWFPHVELYFSTEGFHFPRYESQWSNSGLGELLAWLTQGVSPGWAWAFYAITISSLVLLTLGLFTRAAVIVFFLSLVYHYYLYLHMFGTSFHKLLLITCGVLVFSPCGNALSLDAWRARRQGRPMSSVVSLVTQRIICFEIALVYLGTGGFKLIAPTWADGAVLRTALIGEYGTVLGQWMARQPIMTDAVYDGMVLMVITLELLMPIALFLRRTQKWAFLVGSGFHLFNGIFLDIPQFYIMILTYPLFLPPLEARRAIQWILIRMGASSPSGEQGGRGTRQSSEASL